MWRGLSPCPPKPAEMVKGEPPGDFALAAITCCQATTCDVFQRAADGPSFTGSRLPAVTHAGGRKLVYIKWLHRITTVSTARRLVKEVIARFETSPRTETGKREQRSEPGNKQNHQGAPPLMARRLLCSLLRKHDADVHLQAIQSKRGGSPNWLVGIVLIGRTQNE